MKIKQFLIIILILFSSIPLIISHSIIFIHEEQAIRNGITEKLNSIATIQHKRIQQFILRRVETVNLISTREQLMLSLANVLKSINSKDKELKKLSNTINNTINAVKSIESITIYSIQKNVIYSTVDPSQPSHHLLSNQNYAFKGNELNIKIHQKNDQSLSIEIVEFLFLNNEVIGYISVEFFTDDLLYILSDYTGLGNTGEMVLAAKNDDGNTQFLTPTRHNTNFPVNITVDKDNQNIPIAYAINGKSAILEDHNDYRNIPVLAISRHIPETGWGMIVKIDYDEVFFELKNIKHSIIKFILLLLITIIIIAFYLGKKLSEPICTLESIANLIKKGNSEIQAPNSFLYEIDKLGIAFNSMVSSLLNSENFLHYTNKKLKQANSELLAEAKRFKQWKESNFIGIIHSDDNGQIIDANEAFLNMIGYSEVELHSSSIDWLHITPKEFHHLDISAIDEADEKGYWTPFEKAYIHKDGHHVPILIGGSIFKHNVKEYIVFVVDLSDRNNRIDELAKYKGIIENSSDLFAFVDNSYQFKTVNSACLRAYGFCQSQVINHTVADVLGEEFFEKEIKQSMDSVIAGKTIKFVATQDFKDIGKRDLLVTFTPYKDNKNNIIGLIFKGEDITQFQKQKKLIDLKVAEQEQIVSSMLEGIITTDEQGIVLLFNPQASFIFGYLEHEVVGKNISMLMPTEVAKNHSKNMFSYPETRDTNAKSFVGNKQGREVTALHKDKHTFPLRISVAELPTIEGDEMHFIANCQDLTEIVQQKEILNRTLKMESIGNISCGIAHDFNNLLGIIVGYAELLKIEMKNDKEKRLLAGIALACERGAKLTKSLLTFSKYRPSEAKVYCINNIILDNKAILKAMITTKISLTLRLENELVTTLIDKSLFEDMLLNFSINSLQAMKSGGELTIKTNNKTLNKREANLLNLPTGDYVKLTIQDSGCGMDEETLSKIYEPYFTTKEEQGNGLGLFQCYGFVKSSSGSINVQSTLNKGTTFFIYFPEIIEEKNKIPDTIEPKLVYDNFSPKKYTILIVDDESDIRYLNTQFIMNEGFNVHSCDNAFDALKILKNETVDFIISDVVMPKMGGIEFIKQAKLFQPGIKYLFVSGYLDVNDYKEVDSIKPILYKPYKAQNLIKKIKSSLCE